jgi:fluoride exporter
VITAVAFVVAAAGGALARAEIGRRWNRHDGVPLGTLIVNVTGSFLLGLLTDVAPPALTIAGAAGLGAYTTFSSFARDAVALLQLRQAALAAVYVVTTCAIGITAAALGVALS